MYFEEIFDILIPSINDMIPEMRIIITISNKLFREREVISPIAAAAPVLVLSIE